MRVKICKTSGGYCGLHDEFLETEHLEDILNKLWDEHYNEWSGEFVVSRFDIYGDKTPKNYDWEIEIYDEYRE